MIEGLRELGLEHIAWVITRFILEKLPWELSPSVEVSLPLEVPRETLQDQELSYLVEVYLIRLLELLPQSFIN